MCEDAMSMTIRINFCQKNKEVFLIYQLDPPPTEIYFLKPASIT